MKQLKFPFMKRGAWKKKELWIGSEKEIFDEEAITEYFKTHSDKETCEKFGISKSRRYKITGAKVREDITNKKFGRLTVRRKTNRKQNKDWLYECDCDCGNKKDVRRHSLLRGSTRSCGCLRKETARDNSSHRGFSRNGLSKTVEYGTWRDMIKRCTNPNCKAYPSYGGRGIDVCERWLDAETGFFAFLEDMGKRPEPGKDGKYSIDRIDNDKGYSLYNCRWATSKQQCNNRFPGWRKHLDVALQQLPKKILVDYIKAN